MSNDGRAGGVSQSPSNLFLVSMFLRLFIKKAPAPKPSISSSRLRHWLAPPLGTHLRKGVLSLYLC